jgi:hypothetical protein
MESQPSTPTLDHIQAILTFLFLAKVSMKISKRKLSAALVFLLIMLLWKQRFFLMIKLFVDHHPISK